MKNFFLPCFPPPSAFPGLLPLSRAPRDSVYCCLAYGDWHAAPSTPSGRAVTGSTSRRWRGTPRHRAGAATRRSTRPSTRARSPRRRRSRTRSCSCRGGTAAPAPGRPCAGKRPRRPPARPKPRRGRPRSSGGSGGGGGGPALPGRPGGRPGSAAGTRRGAGPARPPPRAARARRRTCDWNRGVEAPAFPWLLFLSQRGTAATLPRTVYPLQDITRTRCP